MGIRTMGRRVRGQMIRQSKTVTIVEALYWSKSRRKIKTREIDEGGREMGQLLL